MEEKITFESAEGLKLAGTVSIPDDLNYGEKRPGFIVLHGFGSNSSAGNTIKPCQMLNKWGYVTLRFDMRGCGDSEGEFGRVICLEQVEDTQYALDYFLSRPEIAGNRIGLMASSFGAAVAIYTAGIDERPAAVVSSVGWGNGKRKFRAQHATSQDWKKFTDMLSAGATHKRQTGKSLMVSRYDIVPIPKVLRTHLAEKSVMQFPVETAQSMFDFNAEEVVGNIAPRPLLLLHAARDSICPTEQSIELFRNAGESTELHLISGVDHFLLAEGNARVRHIVKDWVDRYFSIEK